MATQSLGRIKICGSIGDAPSRTLEPRAAVVRRSAAGPPQLVAHRAGRPLGVNRYRSVGAENRSMSAVPRKRRKISA
jgi:hypothetical protein